MNRERRLRLPCDMCRGSLKPGYLWLGGKDYLECPNCGGTTVVEMVEATVTPGTHVFMPARDIAVASGRPGT